jgi:hypothetical protein
MECLGLHNKPKAEVHLGHKLMGSKEEEEEEETKGLLYIVPPWLCRPDAEFPNLLSPVLIYCA